MTLQSESLFQKDSGRVPLYEDDRGSREVSALYISEQQVVDPLVYRTADATESVSPTELIADEGEEECATEGPLQDVERSVSASAGTLEDSMRLLQEQVANNLAEDRARIERLRATFARDRRRFFAAAESQVVLLALAIAKKVLAREVERETLPLRATVKMALARLQDSSRMVLRVSHEEQDLWRNFLQEETPGGGASKIEVRSEAALSEGDCILETSLGRIDMRVEIQLAEIARSFRKFLHEESLPL